MSQGSQPPPSTLWFPFGHEIVRSGLWARLSKGARTVYPVICTFADFATGECYPSIRKIAELSGTGTSKVILAIKELTKAGLLVRWSGNQTQSNRYRVTLPGVANPATPRSQTGDTPGAPLATGLSPERLPNKSQVTTVNITTTINNAAGSAPAAGDARGGSSSGNVGDLLREAGRELELGKVGLEELSRLIQEYGGDWVGEAFREAVLRGRKTLQYMEGILGNWKRKGRVERQSRRAAREAGAAESQARRASEREEELRRHEAARRAHQEVEARLKAMDARELAILRAEAEIECDRERIPAVAREAQVTSKLRRRVAERYGVEGL